MLTQTQPIFSKARLIMDSRNMLLSVRSQSPVGTWSQLYKAEQVYLDLRLTSNRGEAVLMGQLVVDPSTPIPFQATVSLKDQEDLDQEVKEYRANISSIGSFRLPIPQSGVYRVEIDLENHFITIDNLEF